MGLGKVKGTLSIFVLIVALHMVTAEDSWWPWGNQNNDNNDGNNGKFEQCFFL